MCFPSKSLKPFRTQVEEFMIAAAENQEKINEFLETMLHEAISVIEESKSHVIQERKFTVEDRHRLFHAFEKAAYIHKLLQEDNKTLQLFFMDVSDGP